MKHVRNVNEFFSFSKAKENFKKGQEMARQFVQENPEALEELKSKIEELSDEERAKLGKVKLLENKPDEVEKAVGEIGESSRFMRIIDKIGAFLGIGAILTPILGGLGAVIAGGLQGQPLTVAAGFIATFIGLGLMNMGSSDDDRDIRI